MLRGVSTRCRIEKKRRKKIEREHRPESTLMDIPNWKCSKKLQRKKTIATIEIHYSAKLQKWKYEDEWKQSKSLYDSCAQDYSSLENQRLSLEKIHGQPFQKACSKSSGSSSALGGKRIKLRPQWPGVLQRRPRTHASPIHFSRKVIAWRTKDTTEKPNRESIWIAFKSLQRSFSSAYSLLLRIDSNESRR